LSFSKFLSFGLLSHTNVAYNPRNFNKKKIIVNAANKCSPAGGGQICSDGFCYPSTKACPTNTKSFRGASCDCDNSYCPCPGSVCTSTLEVNSKLNI
jgi:hypothetical protein